MKALTFRAVKQVCLTDAADPELMDDNDVIVKVMASAVCGSDLHVWHGRETGLDKGTIMGHELAGEIVAVGKGVKKYGVGRRVVSPFSTNCGHCFYCKIGLTCRCENGQLYGWREGGRGLHGAQAQYVRVPLADSTLLPIDDSHISYEAALLIGDVRATGYYCALQADIKPTGVYVVIGCGPVGLMAALAAVELGAHTVFALDNIPERLQTAAYFGAIPLNVAPQNGDNVENKATNYVQIIKEATQGRGADAVLEAVGSESAVKLAYELLRPGGIIASVGVHTTERFAFSPIEAYNKNVTFKIGRAPVRPLMPRLIEQTLQSDKDMTRIITHRFSLKDGEMAYRLFDSKQNGCIKAVLLPND